MLFEPDGIVFAMGNAICCMRIIDQYSFPQESELISLGKRDR